MGDVEAIEETVRAYFDALPERGDNSAYCDGALELLARCEAQSPFPLPYVDPLLEINELSVSTVDGDRALVDFRAAFSGGIPDGATSHPFSYWYSGPIELRRRNDRWVIVDYKRNGQTVAEFATFCEGRVERGGITLEPIVLEERQRGVRLYMRLASERELLRGWEAGRLVRWYGPRMYPLLRPTECAAGEESVLAATFPLPKRSSEKMSVSLPVYRVEAGRWTVLRCDVTVWEGGE